MFTHRPGIAIRSALCVALALAASGTSAQLARKPSMYEDGRAAGTAAPQELMARPAGTPTPSQAMGNHSSQPFAAALHSQAEFDQFARVYNTGTPLAQPHVIFVIDRQARPAPRLYFINTPRFQLHDRFLREQGLLVGGKEALNRNYRDAGRRFILGTLSWQPQIDGFVYEFWEGDQLTATLLRETEARLQGSFFAPVRFKANSSAQEQVAAGAGIAPVTQSALIGQQRFLPLNPGQAVGRLRLVDDIDQARDLLPSDIVVLRQVPITLPPVAGVVTEQPSTMVSHVNLLARGWGVPNAYVRDASRVLATHNGQWVQLTVGAKDYQLRAATADERENAIQKSALKRSVAGASIHKDTRTTALQPLAALRAQNRSQCGAKAANLGEVRHAAIAGISVPDGFCVPFGSYTSAMQRFGLAEKMARMQQQPGFDSDAAVRRTALAALRTEIEQMPLDATLTQHLQARWASQLQTAGVFVRSSSSSEDLPGFSGAGLYTTVPNVKGEAALLDAVRKVWASVFNFEAWEARHAAGIAQDAVAMAVLVQKAVDSEASGVMVTRDPLGGTPHSVFIAAKRGIGIRVVEGRRVAEQVLYSRRSRAVQVLSRSAEDTELRLAPGGGVQEVAVAQRQVLTDALVQRLADAGAAIEARFGARTQDIEWAVAGDRILILQSRPFVQSARN
ncbi:PEP/pyruvate-binding domain-containing protein [Comamonas odontotermitis]|uniref:PEP/pyruvate-binding domain-containing protein n=1 Tax=Comamonas odontotermitis TaxID=379895 RepID=UPI001CC57D13|nr:PEP/pyruvate-binding domain-containing protein [Comamonas odontotermitis]UBB16497.1 pyruvate, phosphate dikinase [Comamonas odontotermitis]